MHAVSYSPCKTPGLPTRLPVLMCCLVLVTMIGSVLLTSRADAYQPPPQAPACVSWLPHGYGGEMHVPDTGCFRQKSYWGFRSVPEHGGSWAHPLWGWDVNGFYRGPNTPKPDPGMYQLPIGLIYPEHGPMPGGATSMTRIRK